MNLEIERNEKKLNGSIQIVVIGLGYVGLPLAVEFGKSYETLGLDINEGRIKQLISGLDKTREVSKEQFELSIGLSFTARLDLDSINNNKKTVFIVTVPTPIDKYKNPDLRPLLAASSTVGKFLKKGDVVVYESTVFPGCTEEECVPVLEYASGLKFNVDFFCGYSPERINPGDKVNTLTKILKITSGSTPETADFVDSIYKSIITAGTYKTSSIKVAEAAKLIENCQRDVNISFVNELALIFDRMEVDTAEVLAAAGTKWNFLKFKPGLVGGHCIGVDPYYMIHKAEQLGYYPEVIGAGRRINDNMGEFVANKVIKLMINAELPVKGARALIFGFTFKENCPDTRNTKVVDIYEELKSFNISVDIYDPWANSSEVFREYGIRLLDRIENTYHAIILAVSHNEFLKMDLPTEDGAVVYDIKGVLDKDQISSRL